MIFSQGGSVITKKKHACGGDEWLIVRTGADYKLKCKRCGHVIFLSPDQMIKVVKKYDENGVSDVQNS